MLRLPDEILLRTLKCVYYIDKTSLLACRIVCRKLADIGQGLAFEHLTFTQDEIGYQRLLDVSKSPELCKRVECLTCYFEDFDTEAASTPEKFRTFQKLDRKNCTLQELHKAYEEYCRGRQYQDLLEDSFLDIASLTAALFRFQRLRSVNIRQYFSHRSVPSAKLLEPYAYKLYPFAYSLVGLRFFKAITSALCVSGVSIEDLTLGSNGPSLIGIIQGLTPTMHSLYGQAFGNVRRLNILLPGFLDTEDELNLSGISALIHSAPLLEELRLEFDTHSAKTLAPSFLASLKCPRLRTFELSWAVIRDPLCLVQFLVKHAASLKSVDFTTLTIRTGSWQTVFIGMRDSLTLESISMQGEFRQDEFPGIYPNRSKHGGRAIEDFIQRNTIEDPFDLLDSTRVSFQEAYKGINIRML